MKPWKEVIDGIRNAVLGKEVREDIAQMGEYVEQFANTAGENIQKAIDPTLTLSGKAADAKETGDKIGQLREDKVDKPSAADDGKIPRAKEGEVEWVEVGQPTDNQTDSAVAKWLDNHPEATTTVQDDSLDEKKLQKSFRSKIKKTYIKERYYKIVSFFFIIIIIKL